MLTQILNKWPDLLEVYRDVEDGPPKLLFVVVRKNSRTFQADQLALLRVLEEAGQKVVVRVGNVDLSLDQFEMGGTYGVQSTQRIMAQSTFYNKQAELRRYEVVLEKLPLNNPSREAVTQRVIHLKSMLGVAEDNLVDKQAIAASDERLNHLKELIEAQDTDEYVLALSWGKVQEGTDLYRRKQALHKKRLEEQNAASKPINASEGEDKTLEAQRDAVDSVG